MGIATAIAIRVIKSVPVKIGIAPNNPSLATWSSLIAVWGLHVMPSRKSNIGTFSKKRNASKINEKIIPIVVMIAIVEHKIRRLTFVFSTACLARNATEILRKEKVLNISPIRRVPM